MATLDAFKIGDARVEPASNTLYVDDEARHVSPKAMDVLLYLVERPGELVGNQELMEQVWGGAIVGDSSIYERIKELRKALGDSPRDSKVLQTVPKRGYRLIAEVTNGPGLGARASAKRNRTIAAFAGLTAVLVGAAVLYLVNDGSSTVTPQTVSKQPVIAVLPFETLSANGDHAHLGEMIAEELIHELSNRRNLRVIARTSSFAVDLLLGDVRVFAEKLGASWLVEGSISGESAEELKVIAQLIDAESGHHIWSRAYAISNGTLNGVQREIASDIGRSLGDALEEPGDKSPLPGSRAYDQFLLGTHFLNRRSVPRDADNAVHYFERAIEFDPGFARAYVGLAKALTMQSNMRRIIDGADVGPMPARAVALLDKSLQLNPELADAKAMLGHKARLDGSLDDAEKLFEAARQADNNLVDAVKGLARVHHRRGHNELALATMREALALDPLSPGTLFDVQWILKENGEYQEALTLAERAVALNPDASSPFFWLATYKTALGEPDAAIRLLEPLIGDPRFVAEQPGIYARLVRSYMDLTDFEQAAALAETAENHGYKGIELKLARGAVRAAEELIHESRPTGVPYHASLYESIIGHRDHALALYEDLRAKDKLDYLGHVYWGYHPAVHAARLHLEGGDAALGQTLLNEVRARVEPLLDDPQNRSGAFYVLASIDSISGNVDQALEMLEQARRAGWCRAWLAKVDPNLAALHDHPAFLRQIHAVESTMAARRAHMLPLAMGP